jgi:hypothetical protein
VQIELVRRIATEPATAFAVVADVVDWPQIIGSIKRVELLTPAPIRVGTRFREDRILFGRDTTQDLEVETIDIPRRFRLLVAHPDLQYELDHLIDGIYGGGCRVTLTFRSRPKTVVGHALQPMISPMMEITLRDELEQDFSDLVAALPPR